LCRTKEIYKFTTIKAKKGIFADIRN